MVFLNDCRTLQTSKGVEMTSQRILLILLQTALFIQLVLSGVSYVTGPAVASGPDDFDQAVVKIESEKNGTGAGVVICIDGNTASIITAAHVVKGDQVVRVSIAPREDITYQAQVKKVDNRDPYNGLALIVLQDEDVRKLSKLDFDTVD